MDKYELKEESTDWSKVARGIWNNKGDIASEIGIQAAGEIAVPPMFKPERIQRDISEKPYAGTGNNFTDFVPWAFDRANDFTSYRMDKLIPDSMKGKAVQQFTEKTLADFAKKGAEKGALSFFAQGLADSRFLPNAGNLANVGMGVGVGLGVPLAANVLADKYEKSGDPRGQYQRAVSAGDREEADRIAADINTRSRRALGAKTMANGMGTGSIMGPKGMLAGLTGAGIVVGLQNIFNEDVFSPAPDAYWNSPRGKASTFRHKFGSRYKDADKFTDEEYENFESQYQDYLGADYDEQLNDFNLGVGRKIKSMADAGDKSAAASYARLLEIRKNYQNPNNQ